MVRTHVGTEGLRMSSKPHSSFAHESGSRLIAEKSKHQPLKSRLGGEIKKGRNGWITSSFSLRNVLYAGRLQKMCLARLMWRRLRFAAWRDLIGSQTSYLDLESLRPEIPQNLITFSSYRDILASSRAFLTFITNRKKKANTRHS